MSAHRAMRHNRRRECLTPRLPPPGNAGVLLFLARLRSPTPIAAAFAPASPPERRRLCLRPTSRHGAAVHALICLWCPFHRVDCVQQPIAKGAPMTMNGRQPATPEALEAKRNTNAADLSILYLLLC